MGTRGQVQSRSRIQVCCFTLLLWLFVLRTNIKNPKYLPTWLSFVLVCPTELYSGTLWYLLVTVLKPSLLDPLAPGNILQHLYMLYLDLLRDDVDCLSFKSSGKALRWGRRKKWERLRLQDRNITAKNILRGAQMCE